jgi:hypothetical protein
METLKDHREVIDRGHGSVKTFGPSRCILATQDKLEPQFIQERHIADGLPDRLADIQGVFTRLHYLLRHPNEPYSAVGVPCLPLPHRHPGEGPAPEGGIEPLESMRGDDLLEAFDQDGRMIETHLRALRVATAIGPPP